MCQSTDIKVKHSAHACYFRVTEGHWFAGDAPSKHRVQIPELQSESTAFSVS